MHEHIRICYEFYRKKVEDLDSRKVSDSSINPFTFQTAGEVRNTFKKFGELYGKNL